MVRLEGAVSRWTIWCNILDNTRYILRKLSHTRTAELKHHPSSRQMLFFRVSYPLGLVLVTVCDYRHVDRV